MRKIFFWVSRERSVFCSGSKINIHLSRLFFLSTPSPVHIWVMSFPFQRKRREACSHSSSSFPLPLPPTQFCFYAPAPSSSGSQEHGSFVQRPPALIFHCPLNMNYGLPPIPLPPPFALVAPGGGQTPVNKPAASTRRGEPCQVFFQPKRKKERKLPYMDRPINRIRIGLNIVKYLEMMQSTPARVSGKAKKNHFLIGNQLHWSYFFVTKIP